MAVKYAIYKCEICGNIVTVVEDGGGELVCCGQEMTLIKEKTVNEEGKEKHVPVVEINGNKVTVTVGSVHHPMEPNHYIMLIQLMDGEKILFEKWLNPGEPPVAEFLADKTEHLKAREYCNVHGLWKN